ncbi:MAG: transglycosylase SLT domain-containing protein [Chloroflexi bacterium]|nr:transglycosylase SLT domain-containing protein [Chloroflexota bacterium]
MSYWTRRSRLTPATRPLKRAFAGILSIILLCAVLLTACNAAPTAEISIEGNIDTEQPSAGTAAPEMVATAAPTVVHDISAETTQAYQALEEGNYQAAISLISELLTVPVLPNREGLQIALARAYLETHQPQPALELLVPLANSNPPDEYAATANGMAAQAYEADGQWQLAITALTNFMTLQPETEPDIRWHLARLYTRAGDYDQSVYEYQQVDRSAFSSSRQAELLEESATALRQTGNYTEALHIYDTILTFAQNADYRALVSFWQGDTLLQAQRPGEAGVYLLQAYQEAPSSYAAYLALQSLKGTEQNPFTALQEAWIYYGVGQYEASSQSLDTFIMSGGAETAETYYLHGLIAEEQEDLSSALSYLEQAVQSGYDGYYLPEAWLARARVMAANGISPVASYREFTAQYPDSPYAATALWRAALYSQSLGDWLQAEQDYAQLAQLYPENELAAEAGFRAGLMAYAATDVSRAQEIWSQIASRSELDPTLRTKLTYWLGVAALRLTGVEDAQTYWTQVAADNPDGYYGLRATDQLTGADLLAADQPSFTLIDDALSETDWQNLEAWVTTWYTDINEPVNLAEDPSYQRAAALWNIGWQDESLAVLARLRASFEHSPLGLVALARQATQLQAYSTEIDCAVDIIELAWQAGQAELPAELWRLAHPMPYFELFTREGAEFGTDPLLLLALAKQESQFIADAVSPAGAVGMAQIMPDTGSYIASQLAVDYDPTQLVLPITSIRFGAWYLTQSLGIFSGSILPALAAYNAGPGAVQNWLSLLSFTDDDLFYELVPYAETRAYLSQVYRNYRIYQRLQTADKEILPQE